MRSHIEIVEATRIDVSEGMSWKKLKDTYIYRWKKSKQSKHVNLGRENRPRIILVSVFTGFTGTPINIQTWLQGNQNHA